MSRLARNNGDDYPEAARKHQDDASVLNVNGRPDGSAYHAGYVVECALKTLIQYQTGVARGGHNLVDLASRVSAVCTIAGSRTARYLATPVISVPTLAIAAWRPGIRYRAPSMTPADAGRWLGDAEAIYKATVGKMFLDGVI